MDQKIGLMQSSDHSNSSIDEFNDRAAQIEQISEKTQPQTKTEDKMPDPAKNNQTC